MTVLEVLKMVSLYLNLYDNFQPLFEGGSLPTEDDQVFLKKIMSSINLTAKSLSCLYKLKTKEEIEIDQNNSFSFKSLSKPLNKICVLKDSLNKKHKFTLYSDKLLTNFSGRAYIEYFYFPNTVESVEDTIELNPFVSLKTFCLGVVSEYCYINNLFDDAAVWEERFNKSLKNKSLSCNVLLPSKRWF